MVHAIPAYCEEIESEVEEEVEKNYENYMKK